MPPAGGPKRKRSDRKPSGDDNPRASPHRPEQLDLAKQSQSPTQPRDDGARPARRQSRGARNAPPGPDAESRPPPTADALMAQSSSADTGNGGPHQTQMQSTVLPRRSSPYEYITDAIVGDWTGQGREKIKAQLVDLGQNEEDVALDILVQELVESATTNRTDPHDTGLLVKEAIASTLSGVAPGSSSPIQDALLGGVSILFADDDAKAKEGSNPNAPQLAIMLAATEINPDLLRIELDAKLMEQLNLIRNSFHRQVIRKQTNVLYRQSNYNLLREESEGFSKLVTELFTTSGNEAPHGDVVEAAVERVKAMIGAFDLDVGRSLDVVLDVFGSVLVKQYRFFVKFLRASPWWPRVEGDAQKGGRFDHLSGLPLWAMPGIKDWQLSEDQKAELVELAAARDAEFWPRARKDGIRAFFQLGPHEPAEGARTKDTNGLDSRQQWTNETGTVSHAGSREAAQLLGFKLRFYAPGAEGDGPDGTPRNLIYLAALLIKIGFISLHDLYPHLWRPDEEMEKLKEIKTQEKADRERASRPGAGASNALANAGALSDDTVPVVASRLKDQGTRASTPAAESEKSNQPAIEKPDQKVLLLQSLLAIGALPEALFILGRFPWMMDLIHELPEYVNRILHHCLSLLYDELRPLKSRQSLHAQQPLYETDLPGLPKGHATLEQPSQRRVLRWPLLDRDDSEADGINYRFYWDEWNDNIPICRTVDDVFTLCETFLPLVGAKIGYDPALILKFARIGKASLRNDDSSANRERWLDLIKRLLLPSISLTKSNPGVVNEVYELISFFTTQTRYQMYLEWLQGSISRSPDMVSAKSLADAETKDVLRRISKTNVKPMARALARIAYANPHVVVDRALRQIEVYDSIADVFVEGARYFTDLGYDVLTWSLIMAFGKDDRVGMQADGLFTSRWLTALAHFIGKIYKRYALMKPAPILQYVAKQLDNGIHIDLVTLEQMITSMAGIASDSNFNDAQLLAMGGGPLLQSQTMLQLLDQRHASRITAKRLMKALHDCGLVGNLLIALAKQRQACIFEAADAPLKVVGHTFDEITRVLSQYLELLRSNLSTDEFQKHVPSTTVMLNEFDIPAEVAFWIGRPMIQAQMSQFDKDNIKDPSSKDVNGDVEMNDQDASSEDGEAGEVEVEDVATTDATPVEEDNFISIKVDEDMTDVDAVVDEKWHPVLNGIMDDIRDRLPKEVRDVVGIGFYVTFWQLSLYDISVPGKSYEDEMNRQKKKMASITADRSNVSSSGARARESSIKQIKQLLDDLLSENRQHLKAYSENRSRLSKEKEQWFASKSRMHVELNKALMEHCFLPRILLSPLDAYFCFRFAKMLHSLGTANFRTLGFYDLLFNPDRLTSLFFMCTSKESDNFGKFLGELLKDLARWHSMKMTYEREAFGTKKNLPGFALKVEHGKVQLLLDFEKFRSILFKWHSHLHAALAKCLSSPEYMHVRNAISILRTISPVFPAVDHHGKALFKAVEKLGESDREDLKVASQALRGALYRRQKEWVPAQAFRQGPSIPQEPPNSTPEPQKPMSKSPSKASDSGEASKKTDSKMRDAPPPRAELTAKKEGEKTPSATSRDGGRSPSRTSTPLPSRPPRDNNSLRPSRPDGRHELPRRVSPPPRLPLPSTIPNRSETDLRNGYRESRSRATPHETTRSDSRTGYSTRHPADRSHEASHDLTHRYPPRPSDRPSMLDRDDRPSRREHESRQDPRAGHEDRRYTERDVRPEREPRSERDLRSDRDLRPDRDHARPSDRDHLRTSERPERSERDHGRSTTEHTDRRREEAHTSNRREGPSSSRNATPSAPAPSINPERAALIQSTEDSTPSMAIRGSAQQNRPRSSRPPSPRREDDRRHGPRTEKDDRHERRPDSQSRNAQPVPSSAPSRSAPISGPPNRDTRSHGRPPVDMAHGRLEQESPHRPSPRTDRASDPEPPSGPRNRPSNASLRNTDSAPTSRPAPPNRQPPSGPGGRHTRNNSYADPAMSPPSSDTAGIHPDRMNQIAAEPVRPQRPPPVQTTPPSGPRGNNIPPTGPSAPSPNTRGPPSGPQVEGGRGQRHPMTAVNNTLAQAAQGPRGPTGRGRGGMRQNSISFSGPGSVPQSPVGGQPGFNAQQDSMNNPNGMPVQPRGPPRQDNLRDEGRSNRHGPGQRDERGRPDSGYKVDDTRRGPGGPQGQRDDTGPPRNGPRGYPRATNPNGDRDDGPPTRKHGRDESMSAPYGGGLGRGGRIASDAKRSRRGG